MSPTKKRSARYGLIAVALATLIVFCTPLLVSSGVRFWIWWQAREQKLTCTVDKIEAPFLRPVELRGLHVSSNSALRFDLTVTHMTVSLNLRSMLLRTRGRAIAAVTADDVRGALHRNQAGNLISERGWNTLQKSLPGALSVARLNLRVEDGPTVVVLRDAFLNVSEIETGRFGATEITISSPFFRQTFAGLRGATNWQNDRLTIAGLSLARGLDLQSITADLSHLSKEHIGLDVDVDAFGGKIRANVSNEWRAQQRNWIMAGAATDISLEQTSQALGFTDRLTGKIHACKFTFRGDPRDPIQATASLWVELTQLSWQNRAADVIMLGAALYNRQIQLQQLYVKQKNNQLTLNGEAGFAAKAFDWFNPDFRGTISASIGNLGDFASLFGANAGDFGGEVAVEGTMNAGDRKIGGHIEATGKALSIFKTPVDTLAAKLNLTPAALEIEQLELHRQNSFVRGQGKLELAKEHSYSGNATIAAENMADYLRFLPLPWRELVTSGAVNGDWTGTGKTGSHSGTFRLGGRGLHFSRPTGLVPFAAEVQADYSPGSVFFRQAHFANDHFSLNGFVTIAGNYLQLQAIALDLNGKPKLRGNAFLPMSLSKIASGSSISAAIDQSQKVDVDLSVDPTDLGELSAALMNRPAASGTFATRLSIFGGVDALQGWADLHLRDFALPNDSARMSGDAEMRFSSGIMNTRSAVQFTGSSPIALEANTPVRMASLNEAIVTEPITLKADLPGVFLSRLPRWLSQDVFRDGILSGKIAFSGSLRKPSIAGDLQLTNGKLGITPLLFLSEASGRAAFKGETASIDFLNLAGDQIALSLQGELRFADLNALDLELLGNQAIVDLAPRRGGECINSIKVTPLPAGQPVIANIDRVSFHGGLFGKPWTISLTDHTIEPATDPVAMAAATRSFPLCGPYAAEGSALLLGCEPRIPPKVEVARPRKKAKRSR
jgi:hypothetical protein